MKTKKDYLLFLQEIKRAADSLKDIYGHDEAHIFQPIVSTIMNELQFFNLSEFEEIYIEDLCFYFEVSR